MRVPRSRLLSASIAMFTGAIALVAFSLYLSSQVVSGAVFSMPIDLSSSGNFEKSFALEKSSQYIVQVEFDESTDKGSFRCLVGFESEPGDCPLSLQFLSVFLGC
jgi:hypothetical protein